MTTLTATDLSDASRSALTTAARFARRHDGTLNVLHCLEQADGFSWSDLFSDAEEESDFESSASERLASFVDETLDDDEKPAETSLETRRETPGPGIADRAEALAADLVVLGATGRGAVAEYFFGSTAEEVVRRSEPPVLVTPPDEPLTTVDAIVAPVDLSDCSSRSLDRAAELADEERATLHVLHAYVPPTQNPTMMSPTLRPERVESLEERRQRDFRTFVDDADLGDVDHTIHLEHGLPAEVIADSIDQYDADVVVMGTHGRRGFEKFFLGSTASRVLRRMPSAVMTVRGRD